MLKNIIIGSHYRNVFNKDRIRVVAIEKSLDDHHQIIKYKKDEPVMLFNCIISNPTRKKVKDIAKEILVGKVKETNKPIKSTKDSPNPIIFFKKPKRVFEQTYMV